MSVQFADQDLNAPKSLEAQYTDSNPEPLTGLEVSVLLWVYLEAAPGGSDTHTLWWFGETDAEAGGGDPNDLVLEAVAGSQGTAKLRARLRGSAELGPLDVDSVSIGDWHCVAVVAQPVQNSTKLTLYVDGDNTPPSQTGTPGVAVGDWDRFALARNRSGGDANLGEFLCEQIAVWDSALAAGATAAMFADHVPPRDQATKPDFSYWYACGHTRAGLLIDRRDNWRQGGGELFNESSGEPPASPFPQLVAPDDAFDPIWRAMTPVMLYNDAPDLTPVDRTPPKEPSRLQPSFTFTNGPQTPSPLLATSTGESPFIVTPEQERVLAYYHDPNMTAYCGADANASASGINPPYLIDIPSYLPLRDVSQIAKRVADWFEIQNFKAGTGVGPGNNYAGVMWLRAVGHGGLNNSTQLLGWDGPPFDRRLRGRAEPITIFGLDGGVPLQEHPKDWVLEDNKPEISVPWSNWYRENGAKLVKEYMDSFWLAFKMELDRRNLCYPLRAFFDYEDWPREPATLSADAEGNQYGCWQDTYDDGARSGKGQPGGAGEDILNYADSTIENLLDDPHLGQVTWNNTQSMYGAANNTFQQWWNGVNVAARTQAVSESIVATLEVRFPYCQWSNYRSFVADNPTFPHIDAPETDEIERSFNTPVSNDDYAMPAPFSAPVLYSNDSSLNNMRGQYDGRFGATWNEVVRDQNHLRVDASANSFQGRPLAPHIQDVGRQMIKFSGDNLIYNYVVTVEDQRELLRYLWQRGCDEYVMFVFNTDINTYPAKTGVCQWLRDWVHTIPQARQDRVGRVSRLGRRGM